MTIPSCSPSAQNIVEVVKELQEIHISMRHVAPFMIPDNETDKNARKIIEAFPAIADAFLANEEKLREIEEANKWNINKAKTLAEQNERMKRVLEMILCECNECRCEEGGRCGCTDFCKRHAEDVLCSFYTKI